MITIDHCISSVQVVHLDLKPENILLDASNQVKIIDWGFSEIVADQQLLATYSGSFPYCPPELLQAKPYNGKPADCWSLGITLFVMLSGL